MRAHHETPLHVGELFAPTAPILLWVAVSSTPLGSGIRLATKITVVLTGAGTAALVALFVASGAKLQKPNFDGWLNRDELAVESPPTAHRLPMRRETGTNR